MLTDDQVRELIRHYETPRKARILLLLSDVPYRDIANRITDIVAFWEAMAKLYRSGYAPETARRLCENVHEWLPGNKAFIPRFSSAEQKLITSALEKVDDSQEIEAAADLLTVRATSRIDDAGDIFGAALLQLRDVVAQRPAGNQALLVLETEGTLGQVSDETKRRLVDALTALITTDERFRKQVTQAVHEARDARSVAGTGTNTMNIIRDNEGSGLNVQAANITGGVHIYEQPRGGSPESTT